jgi:aerobic-type carbon monoxide dehydrogenase small subunit (CoxS/CutS family)
MVSFNLNGKPVSVKSEANTPLLWVIREELKLTGTKYGCGSSQSLIERQKTDGPRIQITWSVPDS